jgi:hypothetical protein
VDRYSFDVELSHLLLHAGLSRRSETCRNQDRPLHPYLVDVHNARLTGQPIPTPLAAA